MLFQYSVEYSFHQGDHYVSETVTVIASSELLAKQKVIKEVTRRFGLTNSPLIQIQQL
ncbi:DUF3903 domain-containing protein [Ectobacillus polymachus]|uniref:DUF3903 domain-containing protein n=1 Tax=Ectobacillus polymachus TaxID=1508806 RepID=UPI003A8980F4